MATVTLKHVEKIYPNTDEEKKKIKKHHETKNSNLKVSEEGVHAVQNFNLEIKDKEFVVLVGPSGCGKSTTLRMIAGLEEITHGELYIDDKLVNNIAPKDRDIAMVFQNYALYPHMSVLQNIEFPLKIMKLPQAEIDEKVKRVADILDITDYLDRKPKALSGGQRQRVAIGRAIVREPKVLLMDEPLSNLDAKLRNQMRAEIIKLRQRIETTFIYVTHDQTEAMTLGDRIVIMKDGIIQQVGTPQEVFNQPENLFVASFIGTPQMNIYEGDLIKNNEGDYSVALEDYIVKLPNNKNKNLARNKVETRKVMIGVRPQHITLTEDSKAINGTIDVSEMMGSEIHLHIKSCRFESIIVVPTLNSNGKSLFEIKTGASINYSFNGDVVHIFDPENGINLEH